MNTEAYTANQTTLALISGPELVITDLQSALDLMMTVSCQTGSKQMVLTKGSSGRIFSLSAPDWREKSSKNIKIMG